MKTTLLHFIVIAQLVQGFLASSAIAQDPATTAPELRLTGEWELYQNDKPTGLLLDLRQVTNRVHGNYGTINPRNKLGVRKGQEFFRATVKGDLAQGEILLKNKNPETGEIETKTNPFRFKILEKGELLECEIGGDNVKKKQKKFSLRRISTVKNFRLLVKSADGWQPASKIIEDMPMAIEAELTNPTKQPFSFTIKNGNKTITLNASYISPAEQEKSTSKHIARTPLFFPTFGRQLGVKENPKNAEADKKNFGREPTEADWRSLEGIWRAGYIDTELGEIKGWIEFQYKVKKTFNYLDPETNYWHELKLVESGILPSEDPKLPRKWKFKFEGKGVSSEKVEPTKKEDLTELLLDPNVLPVNIAHKKLNAKVEIERSDIADFHTLYLELAQQPGEGLLVWNWSYTAKRETNRDRSGLGRAGEMEVTDPHSTVGTMRGREVWMKNAPTILATFCTENQTRYEDITFTDKAYAYQRQVPHYRYKHIPQIRNKKGNITQNKVAQHKGVTRRVFILASDLPENSEKRMHIKPAAGSDISHYKIRAVGTEDKCSHNAELASAWQTYRAAQKADASTDSKSGKASTELEKLAQSKPLGILALAVLKTEADPGIQKFTLNDVPSSWRLEFGDTILKPQWVRQLATGEQGEAAEWEPTAIAFRPETVRISLLAAAQVKAQEKIYVAITLTSKPPTSSKNTTTPSSKPRSKTISKIQLTPAPNEPNRYLSPPIYLISQANVENAKKANPKGIFIVCNPDDTLVAKFQPGTLFTIHPKTNKLKVKITPDSMNALWKVALKKAADSAGKPIEDWNKITNEEVEEVTNYILTNLVIPGNSVKRTLKIDLGSHAAMLLLRDVFVEMMRAQHADWAKNQSPQKIEAIFRAQRAAIRGRQSPLSYYKIPLSKLPPLHSYGYSNEVFLFQIFDEIDFHTRYQFKGSAYTLQLSAFTYAWKNYGNDMLKSINDAERIKIADIRGLLTLTGYSFQPIVKRLLPRLMKLETDQATKTRNWVPDKIARAYVKSLETIGAAVKAQEDYSAADTSFILTAASLVTIPLGNVSGFWSAMAVGGMTAIEVGHAVYNDVYQQWDIDDQIKGEVAKGAVLGVNRAAQKKSEKLSNFQKLLSVGGAAVGAFGDGSSALKALRGVKSAKILAEGAEILKRADIADPKVLRSLSKGDQAILKKIADGAAELVSKGKTAELTELQLKALHQVEELDIIFKNDALKEIEKLNPSQLADRAGTIAKKTDLADTSSLKNLTEADLSTLRKVRDAAENLKQAGKTDELTDLQKSILSNSQKIDVAYDLTPKGALKKKIADRFAAASKPVSTKSLAKTVDNLTKKAAELGEIGSQSRKHLNQTKKAYDEAIELAKKSPSKKTRAALQRTGKAYRDAKKSSELINDLAGDVTQRAQAAENMLKQAKEGKKMRITKADDRLLSLNKGKSGIDDFIRRQKNTPTTTFSKQERDMMRKLSGLKKNDVQAVEDLVKANGGDWSDISKLANGTGNDMLNMHRIAAYRRLKMNKLADQAVSETKAFLKNSGVDEADLIPLERNAFGSTNLSSDYDVAIKGTGAELAVQNFNQKVRKLFKGTESGAVVDTNLYTDPVYNIFKQADMTGKIGNLSAKQVDKARQFVFQQMANAKYRINGDISDATSMAQWNKYKNNLLKGVPQQARKAMGDMMDQAVGARNLAEKRITDKLADVADSARNVDGNAKLRVTNELYGETLTDIHHYRRMMDDIDLVKRGKKSIQDIDLPPALHEPKFANQLNEIKKLLGNDATKARGLQELDDIRRQAAINIRSKQGEALYFASEAYQTRGTIGHVVDELQAGGQKVTLKSLTEGRTSEAMKNSKLTTDDYINSFYENGGNLMKELNTKKVLDNSGTLKSGLANKKYNKAATKVAKYFERQLDAAAKSGVDMKTLFEQNSKLKDIADYTIQLNKARNDPSKFNSLVKKLFNNADNAEELFVKRALDFNDLLEGKVIAKSDIIGYANKLADSEKAIAKSAVKYGNTWELGTMMGGKSIQSTRIISDALANENEAFEKAHGDDLRILAGKKKLKQPLSKEEQQRFQIHQKKFTSIKELNTQAAAARSAGLASGKIDQIIQQAKKASAENWQQAAAAEVNKTLQKQTANATPDKFSSAQVSPFLQQRLALKSGSAPSSPKELSAEIKRSGKFTITSDKPLTLTQLNTQVKAGRIPVIIMRDAKGKPRWQELRGVVTDSAGRRLIRIRDASTGGEITMPESLFRLRSQDAKQQVIIDPYRNANGNIHLSKNSP